MKNAQMGNLGVKLILHPDFPFEHLFVFPVK